MSEQGGIAEREGLRFVWFCKDVECVLRQKRLTQQGKSKEGRKFKAKKLIRNVNPDKLSVNTYRMNTSNVMRILDRYLTRR